MQITFCRIDSQHSDNVRPLTKSTDLPYLIQHHKLMTLYINSSLISGHVITDARYARQPLLAVQHVVQRVLPLPLHVQQRHHVAGLPSQPLLRRVARLVARQQPHHPDPRRPTPPVQAEKLRRESPHQRRVGWTSRGFNKDLM